MNSHSSFRFQPSLESLADRLNLSPILPTGSDDFTAPEPDAEPAVPFHRVINNTLYGGSMPAPAPDDVVDGKIITAESSLIQVRTGLIAAHAEQPMVEHAVYLRLITSSGQ